MDEKTLKNAQQLTETEIGQVTGGTDETEGQGGATFDWNKPYSGDDVDDDENGENEGPGGASFDWDNLGGGMKLM